MSSVKEPAAFDGLQLEERLRSVVSEQTLEILAIV